MPGLVEPAFQEQNPQDEQQRDIEQGASRSKLVQRLLQSASDLPNFLRDLLHAQAVTVVGTEAAAFVIERSEQGLGLRPAAHIRPDNSTPEIRQAAIQAFAEFVQPCLAQGRDGALEVPGSAAGGETEPQFCLVTLLRADGEIVAASAVVTRCRDIERAQQRLQSMQMVAGYFDLYMLRRTTEQSRAIAQSHQHVLQLATSVATSEGFESAGMGLCNELATRAGATRVTLGWVKPSLTGSRVRVKALSHTEEFDKKQELIVQIEKAMEECFDQEDVVQFEPDGASSQNVTREAQALSRAQGGNGVISIPLRRKAEIVGVLTLEFAPGQHLGPQAATGLSVAADLLAPQLYDRHENDRWLITKAGISTREGIKAVIGPKYWIAKLCVTAGILLFLVICNWIPFVDLSFPYRVSAQFQFEPMQQREIDAPFEGLIDTVQKRPGQQVKAGDVLFTMDTRELRLEKAKAEHQAEAAQLKAMKAISDSRTDPSKAADVSIAYAERDAALAESKRCDFEINEAAVKADISGVVMEGDLRDQIGSAVKLGQKLMVIGQPQNLRGKLQVAERDIQDVKFDSHGQLATTSLPSDEIPFTVTRIVPKTQAKNGDNYYTVYVALDKDYVTRHKESQSLLAGMAGEARVDVTHKPLVWIWSHRFVEWLSLKLWSNSLTSPFTK